LCTMVNKNVKAEKYYDKKSDVLTVFFNKSVSYSTIKSYFKNNFGYISNSKRRIVALIINDYSTRVNEYNDFILMYKNDKKVNMTG